MLDSDCSGGVCFVFPLAFRLDPVKPSCQPYGFEELSGVEGGVDAPTADTVWAYHTHIKASVLELLDHLVFPFPLRIQRGCRWGRTTRYQKARWPSVH